MVFHMHAVQCFFGSSVVISREFTPVLKFRSPCNLSDFYPKDRTYICPRKCALHRLESDLPRIFGRAYSKRSSSKIPVSSKIMLEVSREIVIFLVFKSWNLSGNRVQKTAKVNCFWQNWNDNVILRPWKPINLRADFLGISDSSIDYRKLSPNELISNQLNTSWIIFIHFRWQRYQDCHFRRRTSDWTIHGRNTCFGVQSAPTQPKWCSLCRNFSGNLLMCWFDDDFL